MENINEILLHSSENLRGHMEFEEYKNNIIGAIFYKYLSHIIEKDNNKKLFKYNLNFEEAFNPENVEYYGDKLIEESLNELGFFIKPNDLYHNLIIKGDLLSNLNTAVKNITFKNQDLNDLYDDVNFENLKVTAEIKKVFEQVLININSLTFKNENNDEFNDMMKFFLKKSYTPNEISLLLGKLVSINESNIKTAYDGTCGSCSTLLTLKNEITVNKYFGQEINKKTYNMARMNMLLHDIHPNNFIIYNEDSTTTNRKLPEMDVIISHPPFLKKWEADDELINDERFNTFKKLPPKSRADYAFIESMIYHLSNNGTMAIVMPQGVLFRTNAEEEIRKTLVRDKNYVDAIIGLPEKSFHKNIPTCILVLKKNREKEDKILFIDASQEYDNSQPLNRLKTENIEKIVKTYKNRDDIEKYSYCADISEIKDNNYNLNIKLYVKTYEEKNKINIKDTTNKINEIEKEIDKLNKEEKELFKKLDIIFN